MLSDNEDQDIDWDNLNTITTFDSYDNNVENTASTRLLADQFIGTIAAKASTAVSLLVESLVQQLCIMFEPDPNSSTHLYHTICEQLHKMNLIDKTYEMGEFEVMRSQYQKALYQLVTVARGQDLSLNLQSVWPLTQPLGYDWSRYYREFDEIQFVAGGGFGKVYKVRHKLDGRIYAVKKVTIKSHEINRVLSHLAEVKTLAALNHNNIVPYKACWLEPLLTDPKQSFNHSNDNCTEDEEYSSSESVDGPNGNTVESDDSSFIQFERSEKSSVVHNESNKKATQKDTVVKFHRQSSLNFDRSQQPYVKLKWATLYIQMAMCHMTLREWLDLRNKTDDFQTFYADFIAAKYLNAPALSRRNSSDEDSTHLKRQDSSEDNSLNVADVDEESPHYLDVVKNIFSQLLDGLDYIHAQNIVHHDIKPSNLFINVECGRRISVQLGDFGLACPLQDDHSKNIVGTPTYAAPEQLEGECDKKSDVYSIGIVLLELLLKYFELLIHEDSDVALVRIFECFLEVAPQKILQITIILGEGQKNVPQILSILSSFLSMAWCIASYHRCIRFSQVDKANISWWGTIMQWLCHFLVSVSRVLSIGAVASIFPKWTLIGCSVHAMSMSLWIFLFDRSPFCSTSMFHSFAISLVLENMICVYFFYNFASHYTSYLIPICVLAIVPFALGIAFMIIYYTQFHPNIIERREVDGVPSESN